MPLHTQVEDEELLAAVAERLREREAALQQSAQMLEELRAVNSRLEGAERLKGQFLSNVRNEINNPLTVLQGFASAIVNNPQLTREKIVEIATIMMRETADLSFQIQNIFAAADLEAGQGTPNLANVRVDDVVASVISELRVIADHKSVEVVCTVTPGISVTTDPAKLGLVLTNLLRNAITFGRQTVRLGVTVTDGQLVIDVRDDGPGVAVQESRRIFDRFVQLSTGSTKAHPGHGLGLSVAQACAELVGGSIEVLYVDGPGAHFRARIPANLESEWAEDASASNELLFDAVETF